MELDCKIVDVSLHSPPVVTKAGFRIVAEFTFLRWPLRIRGCKLVCAPDDTWLIWTPDPAVKFSRAGFARLFCNTIPGAICYPKRYPRTQTAKVA